MGRLAIFVGIALLVALPTTEQVLPGSVSGTVKDQGGLPLPGAMVTLAGPAIGGTRTAVADPQGKFRFTLVPAGQGYSLTCAPDAAEHVSFGPLTVVAGEELVVDCSPSGQPGPTPSPSISPSARPQYGAIVGRVRDTDGLALAGVTVTLAGPSLPIDRSENTDAGGAYGFGRVPEATGYTVRFEKAGFVPVTSASVAVSPLKESAVNAEMALAERPIRLVPEGGGRDAPGEAPSGLAWDYETNVLWVVDAAKRKVWRVDVGKDTEVAYDLGDVTQPGPAVYDQDHKVLWVVDNPYGRVRHPRPAPPVLRAPPRIYRFVTDPVPQDRKLAPENSFPVTSLADTGPITGLAWDDGTLWMSMAGGLCACVYGLDPDDGAVRLSFFPRCEPLAIAVDPKGEQLSIAADRGPAASALLQRRSLVGPKDRSGRPVSALRTQFYSALDTEGKSIVRPSAIATSGNQVWVLDSATKKLLHFAARPVER